MGFISFLQKLFHIEPKKQGNVGYSARFLNGSPYEYGRYSGELYANSLVRSIVHKIASYGSMITFEHVRGSGESFAKVNDSINRLLTIKPNDMSMSPSELQYKVWTDLLLRNNSYQWLIRDRDGRVTSILPVISDNVEMLEIDGFLFYKFTFQSGENLVAHISDIVHNKRYYYKNDFFGTDNDPLRDSVGLVDTMQVSLDAALKNGAQIKGILKHQNTIDPEDLAKHEKLFRDSYLRPTNNGGIGVLDAKFDFIPINYSGKITDSSQMKEIRDYVYRYFNINDNILMSSYTSDQWQAYHEGVIAPILNSMEQNYNLKLFTDKELGFGNRVMSSVNMMTFMSASQKISMVKLALDGALYTRNEIRQWFGDSPIPGGDTFQYSKNFTENVTPNQGQNKEGGENGSEGTESEGTEAGASNSADELPE